MHRTENIMLLGIDMELSNNIELDNFDIGDSYQPDLDKFETTCDT